MNKQHHETRNLELKNARRFGERPPSLPKTGATLAGRMRVVCMALILALIVTLVGLTVPAFAQEENPLAAGPTSSNCFSARFHAASDCDRLASTLATIPVTGAELHGPTTTDCYTTRFHAATDCDRLVSSTGD